MSWGQNRRISQRGEPVCRGCNLDPINRLTEALHGAAAGVTAGAVPLTRLMESIGAGTRVGRYVADAFGHDLQDLPAIREY